MYLLKPEPPCSAEMLKLMHARSRILRKYSRAIGKFRAHRSAGVSCAADPALRHDHQREPRVCRAPRTDVTTSCKHSRPAIFRAPRSSSGSASAICRKRFLRALLTRHRLAKSGNNIARIRALLSKGFRHFQSAETLRSDEKGNTALAC